MNSNSNPPRHIAITGASSGLGAALALHYAAPGVTLSLVGRDETRLGQIAATARAQGALVHETVLDVTDRAVTQHWIESTDDRLPIDLVIANAGVSYGQKDWTDFDQAARQTFAVNLFGVMNVVNPLIARMAARGSGQIAIMASLAGLRGLGGSVAYSASKAAVRAYGEGLRGALARHGVKVNVICPGFVRSRMTEKNKFPMPFLMDADRAARIMARGLARNAPRIAYPWRMYALALAFAALPERLIDAINRRLPVK